MALQIIGAGLGRTGTASTKLALEKLGFTKCYHMGEVISEPTRMAGWLDAARGKPDWDAVFEGYAACVDYPAASFWRELSDYYPDAKVLLNVRPAERWFESVHETIMSDQLLEAIRSGPQGEFLHETVYKPMAGRTNDRAFMVDYFNRHVAAVKETIPAERLLVYEVQDGWEPLCRFLDVPIPADPFPRVNSREETKMMLEMLMKARDWDDAHQVRAAAQKMYEA